MGQICKLTYQKHPFDLPLFVIKTNTEIWSLQEAVNLGNN